MISRPDTLRLLATALLFLPGALAAQTQLVRGKVVEDESSEPLEGVHLTLLDSAGVGTDETLSDSTGAFVLTVPEPGNWSIAAELIGHRRVASSPLAVDIGEQLVVEVRMAVEAIPIEPIVVTSRVNMSPDLRGFYERERSSHRAGFGQFLTRAEIERRNVSQPTQLFYDIAGVHVSSGPSGHGQILRMAGGCIPAIFIDGMQINRAPGVHSLDDYVAAFSIEGIEVYRSPGYQVGPYYDPAGCGLILVWTKRGESDPDSPFSWKKFAIGLGILGAIFLLR